VIPLVELASHVGEDSARIGGNGIGQGVVEYCDKAGARILGIYVDRVRTQRSKCDLRRSESWLSLDGESARFEKLREHLAQQIRLTERLRRDNDCA
jgi:hypothetical protein